MNTLTGQTQTGLQWKILNYQSKWKRSLDGLCSVFIAYLIRHYTRRGDDDMSPAWIIMPTLYQSFIWFSTCSSPKALNFCIVYIRSYWLNFILMLWQ
jgi:hypothetical protein